MSSVDPGNISRRPLWRHSLLAPPVWKRGACYGLPAGLVQAAMNQGDYWLAGHVTTGVAIKTLLSPFIGFGVAYIAALTTHRESHRRPAAHVIP